MKLVDWGLTSPQLEVIDALSEGATSAAAASKVGIHRNTIANWRRNNIAFRDALAHAHHDRALLARERYEEHLDAALETIAGILADPKAPASVRLKAAQAIIDRAMTPPAPEAELVYLTKPAETPAEVHNSAQSERPANQPQPATPTPTPENRPNLHKNAQSVPNPPATYRREGPKIGRNDPCPCGSGIKYKRCCIDKKLGEPLANAA